MATTNPVFQVLVTKGNQAILGPDLKPDQLTPGQIGLFNYNTGLSIDGNTVPNARETYLAVGIDRTNDGVVDDIITSAGQMIQRDNITAYNAKCYSKAESKIVEITDFKAQCETDYAVKIEVRNQLGYQLQGYNQIAKTFNYTTGCCTSVNCTACPEGDCNELAVGLTKAINTDTEKLFKAEMIDYTTTPGTSIVVTDMAAWVALPANAGKCLGIRITSLPEAIKKFCSINVGYFNPRGTDIIVSGVDGFVCNGKITVKQDLKFEEGLGYDIAQLEYEAGGWNGKPGPYRLSTAAGMALTSFESYVDQLAKYLEVNITYNQESVGGWLEYKNNLNTILAIPCEDTVTIASLFAVLDKVLGRVGSFGPLADDVALCDCIGTLSTSTINDTSKDGVA